MEFVEVMKQRNRMCDTRNCVDCPLSLDDNGIKVRCSQLIKRYPEKAEEIIMK